MLDCIRNIHQNKYNKKRFINEGQAIWHLYTQLLVSADVTIVN